MPAEHDVTRYLLEPGSWLRIKGMVRIVGMEDGQFVVETKPLPNSVRIRRKRRNVDTRPPESLE